MKLVTALEHELERFRIHGSKVDKLQVVIDANGDIAILEDDTKLVIDARATLANWTMLPNDASVDDVIRLIVY